MYILFLCLIFPFTVKVIISYGFYSTLKYCTYDIKKREYDKKFDLRCGQ